MKFWWVEGWGSTVLENMFSGFLQNKEKFLPRVKSVSAPSPESIREERSPGLRRELLPRLAAFKVLDIKFFRRATQALKTGPELYFKKITPKSCV